MFFSEGLFHLRQGGTGPGAGLFIVEELGLEETGAIPVDRTVLLSKADLTTNMVYEFDELQGVMGREYPP